MTYVHSCAGRVAAGNAHHWPSYLSATSNLPPDDFDVLFSQSEMRTLLLSVLTKNRAVWGLTVNSTELLQHGTQMVSDFPELEWLSVYLFEQPTGEELAAIFQSPIVQKVKYLSIRRKYNLDQSTFDEEVSRQGKAIAALSARPVPLPNLLGLNLGDNDLFSPLYEQILAEMPNLKGVNLVGNYPSALSVEIYSRAQRTIGNLSELMADSNVALRYLKRPSQSLRDLEIYEVDEQLMKELPSLRSLDKLNKLSLEGRYSDRWNIGFWDGLPLAQTLSQLEVGGREGTIGLNFVNALTSAKLQKLRSLTITSSRVDSVTFERLGIALPDLEELTLKDVYRHGNFSVTPGTAVFPKVTKLMVGFDSIDILNLLLRNPNRLPALRELTLGTLSEDPEIDSIASAWEARGVTVLREASYTADER